MIIVVTFTKDEKKVIFLYILIVSFFVLMLLFSDTFTDLLYDPTHFLIWHTTLEWFSIFISLSIFLYGWISLPFNHSARLFFVSLTFLIVGTFDILHTLTFKGMPFAMVENTVAYPTWFWVLARFTECIGVAIFLSLKSDKKISHLTKVFFLIVSIVYLILVISVIYGFVDKLPVLIREGYGVTTIKKIFEYTISLIHLYSLVLVIRVYLKTRKKHLLSLSVGLLLILLGELFFTLYSHVYDINNFVGHFYKALGYYFLLTGIFFPQFKRMYIDREKAENKFQVAEKLLKEQEVKMSTLTIQAQEEERKRVSRELHDGVGQLFYGLLISLKNYKNTLSSEEAKMQVDSFMNITEQGIKEVKEIAFQLRPSVLDDLGLLSALRSYIEKYEAMFNIKVNFNIEGKKQNLPSDIETTLFRICQETLTNAAKYSETSFVTVIIRYLEEEVELVVQDKGKGFDTKEVIKTMSGLGLYGISERATLLNGTSSIVSEIGKGTTISVKLPVNN